ncbi:putative hydro-lyase [Kitasatospora acidiphila]|uniref:Putative hydro-lyase n=1 Tax=Kitasatospora acidiphila TaxID=2567942 RepID=A0A540W744_9ACTN|nr:putative hydro-lyase [Kitasatospora acidiphila]TQF04144.1 putative hydro-lyase [Kitasatospora acidiphila]
MGADRAGWSPEEARRAFRDGLAVPTAGVALGYAQANLLVVPRDRAAEFRLFAERNPRPCPVLEETAPGGWRSRLAPGADLRTDLPGYQVWVDGELAAEPASVGGLPQVRGGDLAAFLIGCSFTFEAALLAAGVPLRHVEQGRNVAMYVTDRPCRPAGRVHGPLVVSMRPIPVGLVETARAVTARMPRMHGAPLHMGDPAALGVADLARPDYGDPVEVAPGEVPVFWACGVTAQQAVIGSRPPFAITHAPGRMFITDVRNTEP